MLLQNLRNLPCGIWFSMSNGTLLLALLISFVIGAAIGAAVAAYIIFRRRR